MRKFNLLKKNMFDSDEKNNRATESTEGFFIGPNKGE